MIWKAKPKCPECGSTLRRKGKGYSCPNPDCEVVTVFFNRELKVRRVTYEGVDYLKIFSRDL